MADRTPPVPENDPIDQRLRATLRAEHADIERRRAASGATPPAAASRNWLPLAAAATVVAIVAVAGIVLIGNRDRDQAVDLDVAAEPTDAPDPSAGPVPTVASTATAQGATPTAVPLPAPNDCGQAIPTASHFVWDVAIDDPDGGLIAHVAAGVEEPATRVLPYNGVVTPTGGCTTTENGALWYELAGDSVGGNDWVNARYLRATEPACVIDGRVPVESVEPFFHTVQVGDRLAGIADRFNVTVDAILRANPLLDPNTIVAGSQLRIPGATELVRLSDGPLDGAAVFVDDGVAFATLNAALYQWHEADRVVPGACPRGTPTPPNGCPSSADLCVLTGPDDLASLPCERSSGPASLPRHSSAGDAASMADHVHDMRAETNSECTRIVVTFGTGANEAEELAATLPPIVVVHDLTSVRITADGWQMETAFGDTDRIAYDGGVGLLTLDFNYEFAAEFLHRDREPHVRFFEEPARVVIDLFPSNSTTSQSSGPSSGPFGERFVLKQPIQQDLTGPGIPAGEPIVVSGFGRPFEASGLYRIWSVPAGVDAAAFLTDPGTPLIEDFFPTGGWAEGWGKFTVELPRLEPGSYIAVFGELPPTDAVGFYGTGQLFRVTDDPSATGVFPEATLLPNVALAPE